MNGSLVTIIGLLGAFLGFILACAVFSLVGPGRRPNRNLGLLLLILSVAVATITGEHGGLFRYSIYPILLEYVASFLFPPVFWNYSRLVLGIRPRVPIWVHFLPAIAWMTYIVAFRAGWTSWRWLPPIMGVVVYGAIYTTVIAIATWRSGSGSRALASHHRVLKALILILVAVHFAQVVRLVFSEVPMLEDIVPLTATVLLSAFAVLAFRQSRLLAGHEPSSSAKYASSTLTPERVEEIRERLLSTMERDKPFLNENLTLSDLAARLKVSRTHLSQVVNDDLGRNFSDFVTQYRVSESDLLLADPSQRHLSIEDIAYAVGFRSRSAFHNAFKRLRGETPAQIRRDLSQKMFGDTEQSEED